jgi:hypothetical protein
MSDLEENVPDAIKPDSAKKEGFFANMDRTEVMLSATGVALAAFAAYFPWYVFFHHEYFTVRHDGMAQNLRRDLPVGPPRRVFSVSPSASININQFPEFAKVPPLKSFDDIKTATIPEEAKPNAGAGGEKAAIGQPLPGSVRTFRLLHVAGGRALIEDGNGMYIVGVGSVLPDNSKLAAIQQRDGQWVLITTNGDTVGMN